MLEQEVHIVVTCADARDLNKAQQESVLEMTEHYATKGIIVQVQVIRAPGSFVTRDVFLDIKRIIEENQKASFGKFKQIRHYVHVITHGHLTENSNKNYISKIYEMNIVEGSPLNCGMMGAAGVGIEMEQMLMEEKVEVTTLSNKFIVSDEASLREMMQEVYGWDGYLAGDWVKSIDYLRTHPRAQRVALENMISSDPEMNHIRMKVTAGLQDYSIHAIIRVDGGEPAVPFWDDFNHLLRRKLVEDPQHEDLARQRESQSPLAALISLPDPIRNSRKLAGDWYSSFKGLESGDVVSNAFFHMTGSAFDLPSFPYGPYVVTGFYYAVVKLGIRDLMVVGGDEDQTKRMEAKLLRDPIIGLVIKKYNVSLLSLVIQEGKAIRI
jgi:hypothetical protein